MSMCNATRPPSARRPARRRHSSPVGKSVPVSQSGRGAKRIVFSNDGLIYYTDDHYESFTLLYGEENQ